MTENEKLALLADTIAKHAREVISRQWLNIHKPALEELLSRDQEAMIVIGEVSFPSKVVIDSLRTDFMERNIKALMQKIAHEVVGKAYRALDDES